MLHNIMKISHINRAIHLEINQFILLVEPVNNGTNNFHTVSVPSISHQVIFRPLTQELARRGHDVTIITPDPVFPKGGTPPNLTEIDVHDISYKVWRDDTLTIPIGKKYGLLTEYAVIFEVMAKVVDVQLKDENVQKLIRDKNQKFDLVFAEAVDRSAVVYSHIFNAPAIMISSFGPWADNYDVIGAPTHPLLYANNMSRRFYNLTLWEKLVKLYYAFNLQLMQQRSYEYENKMLRSHFGPDLPPLQEIYNNVAMFFLNLHPTYEGNQPVPPSVVHIGGIQHKSDKELPKDLKSYLDSSKNGVIYISFGTNVEPSSLPPEQLQVLVKVLGRVPYDVLWKWNKDELPGKTDNMRISKWLPQSDLLKHPKVKLFITQGGLQSTDEAITAGVPLIGIPMWGDQWFNTERYERHKIGVKLEIETLTEEIFENAIKTVISDDSYRRNIERFRSLIHDQPQSPLERAVWWTEHVLRHGGAKHLRSPAANISWAQYLELELVLVIFAVFVIVLAISIMILRYIYKNILRKYVFTAKVKKS